MTDFETKLFCLVIWYNGKQLNACDHPKMGQDYKYIYRITFKCTCYSKNCFALLELQYSYAMLLLFKIA